MAALHVDPTRHRDPPCEGLLLPVLITGVEGGDSVPKSQGTRRNRKCGHCLSFRPLSEANGAGVGAPGMAAAGCRDEKQSGSRSVNDTAVTEDDLRKC